MGFYGVYSGILGHFQIKSYLSKKSFFLFFYMLHPVGAFPKKSHYLIGHLAETVHPSSHFREIRDKGTQNGGIA